MNLYEKNKKNLKNLEKYMQKINNKKIICNTMPHDLYLIFTINMRIKEISDMLSGSCRTYEAMSKIDQDLNYLAGLLTIYFG